MDEDELLLEECLLWISRSDSFLSVVDKGDPTGQILLVRARRRGDIEAVFPDAAVIENAGTDYRYHARIDREQVALAMAEQVRAIRYPNYKGAVRDEALHGACVSVWSAMAACRTASPTHDPAGAQEHHRLPDGR